MVINNYDIMENNPKVNLSIVATIGAKFWPLYRGDGLISGIDLY